MSRAVAVVFGLLLLAAVLGAAPLDIIVSPNSPNGCSALLPQINCPSAPYLLSFVRPDLTIKFTIPGATSQSMASLEALTVSLSVADNPGLFGSSLTQPRKPVPSTWWWEARNTCWGISAAAPRD